MATLPTTTSEITAEWMTEAPQGSGTIPGDGTVALWTAVIERAQSALIDHGFGS